MPPLRSLAPLLLLVPLGLALASCGDEPVPETRSTPRLPAVPPLEAAGFDSLTSHESLVVFLQALDRGSPRVTLREMGTSVAGRSLPYLEVSLGEFGQGRRTDGQGSISKGDRLMLLIYAQQHGNEPSGKEGALALALELARGDHDDLLERVDVLLVPQVNPDGSEVHRRVNEDGVDLNRSHLILDGVEVAALRELFHRWEPEVAVDVHEYYPWSEAWLDAGWLRLWDVQVGLPTNLNTPPAILRLAEEAALPRLLEALESRGFTGHNYVVGSPASLRWSTTNPNDGRQGLALLHTLSFIFEGKRSEPPATDMARRAEAQRVALEALLRFTSDEADGIRRAVHGAREAALRGEIRRVVLTMGREGDGAPLEIPVEAVTAADDGTWIVGDTVAAVVENWFPRVVERSSTDLPAAYLVPASEAGLIDLLRRHHVELYVLEREERLEVEALRITGFDRVALDSPQDIARLTRSRRSHEARPGDALVRTDQVRGVLAGVLLEPASMHGALHDQAFRHLAVEGPYPVLRVPALGPDRTR
jgi:hypothetical protein